MAALYLSIVPSYVRRVLETSNLAAVAALSSLVLVAACAGQLVTVRPRLDNGRAFATGIYAGVATSLIGVGLLTLRFSLFASVATFAVVMATLAVATAIWHLAAPRPTSIRARR